MPRDLDAGTREREVRELAGQLGPSWLASRWDGEMSDPLTAGQAQRLVALLGRHPAEDPWQDVPASWTRLWNFCVLRPVDRRSIARDALAQIGRARQHVQLQVGYVGADRPASWQVLAGPAPAVDQLQRMCLWQELTVSGLPMRIETSAAGVRWRDAYATAAVQ